MKPRTITLLCYGMSKPMSYCGMGGVETRFRQRVLLYKSWRRFDPALAPGFVQRFMLACEGVWPGWMPQQKPQWEMILS